jgi:hypothetical protein
VLKTEENVSENSQFSRAFDNLWGGTCHEDFGEFCAWTFLSVIRSFVSFVQKLKGKIKQFGISFCCFY